MKRLLFVGLLTLLFSCKKDNKTEQLTGKWEFRGAACYCAPTNPDDIKPGNGNILVFSDNNYTRIKAGQIIKTGTYSVVKDTLSGTPVNRIIYNGDLQPPNATPIKNFFKIVNNGLTLYTEVPLALDGPEEYYERLR